MQGDRRRTARIRIAYAPNKIETAEWIKQMLGTTTVVMDTYSESGKRSGFLSSVHPQQPATDHA